MTSPGAINLMRGFLAPFCVPVRGFEEGDSPWRSPRLACFSPNDRISAESAKSCGCPIFHPSSWFHDEMKHRGLSPLVGDCHRVDARSERDCDRWRWRGLLANDGLVELLRVVKEVPVAVRGKG